PPTSYPRPWGVAGCGAMGLPMARRLWAAGFPVRGLDIRPAGEFADFAPQMEEDPTVFARTVEGVISVVRDASQTEVLCFGPRGLFNAPPYPRLLVVSSTLSPRFLPHLRRRLPEDVALVDAPMSGAPMGAVDGNLTFMVGGSAAAVAAVQPALAAMGRHIHHLGPLGAGMTVKVLNNFVAATSVVAVRRTLARAKALGIDPEVLRQVMAQSSGATWFGDHFATISWAREGYACDNTMAILEKDVNAALDALGELPVSGARDGAVDAFEGALLQALRQLEPWGE
ncbi:MAG: NAD(P)-dependent oxidoreductase, partial [Candidatus Competibacterales bacterium]